MKASKEEAFENLPAPAKRALLRIGVTKPEHIANYTESELLDLNGFSPIAMRTLRHSRTEFAKVCARGHKYTGRDVCPKCWPREVDDLR